MRHIGLDLVLNLYVFDGYTSLDLVLNLYVFDGYTSLFYDKTDDVSFSLFANLGRFVHGRFLVGEVISC
jgi:hypothetical protein